MTGPGRSPSSPWVQTAPGHPHDGRSPQTVHPALSPSNTSLHMGGSLIERSGPNYFGIPVEPSSNSPLSNPGPHTKRNWSQAQTALPSPKLHLYSHESVSDGLASLLRSESECDKGRRESASHGCPVSNAATKNGSLGPETSKQLGN